MTVGLLGFQGAIQDHIRHLDRLGLDYLFVKDRNSLDSIDSIILPGGESTVMKKYLDRYRLVPALRRKISDGIPTWGICAGAILLAHKVDEKPGTIDCIDIHVHRNAYGRQAQSTIENISVPELSRTEFPAVFIRSPKIVYHDPDISLLAYYDDDPVFLRHDNIMITTFHPELTNDCVFHEYFRAIG